MGLECHELVGKLLLLHVFLLRDQGCHRNDAMPLTGGQRVNGAMPHGDHAPQKQNGGDAPHMH